MTTTSQFACYPSLHAGARGGRGQYPRELRDAGGDPEGAAGGLWLRPAYKAEVLAAQALKRLIAPEEVARLVLFLAADDSAAITGQSYVIDGGWV